MKWLLVIFTILPLTISSVGYKTQFKKTPEKLTYPKEVKTRRIKDLKVDSTLLVAMLINDECACCSFKEKKAVANVVLNRVAANYNNYGTTYEDQIFATCQFSGAMKPRYVKGVRKCARRSDNPQLGRRFKYKPKGHYLENYQAAYDVLVKRELIFNKNVVMFCNPAISTNRKFVKHMLKTSLDIPEFEMVYSYDKDI